MQRVHAITDHDAAEYIAECASLVHAGAANEPHQPSRPLVALAIPKIAAQSEPEEDLGKPLPTAFLPLRLLERSRFNTQRTVARKAYRALLDGNKYSMRPFLSHKAGPIVRHYLTGQEPDANNRRTMVLEELHRSGHFGGGFGHVVHDGMPEVMSKLTATRSVHQHLGEQLKIIGRDVLLPDGERVKIHKPEISAMMSVSGMSYPQLSAGSILSLLYAHVRMAKDGVRFFVNTGEGGADLHLALLSGDRETLRREVVRWGIETGEISPRGRKQARVEEFIRILMSERDQLFAEFTEGDIAKAQITAQFGTALNGIRGKDNLIDFTKLMKLGENPHVAMIEYKLKQAAKRGSKVDMSKMEDIAASIRRVRRGERFKSPAINPEFESYEDIATLVIATKLATQKPVSLKFAVGDVENIYEFLEYLLGARDETHLSVAGDIMLPTEAVQAMTAGANSINGARSWMKMGLGCASVAECDNGSCPYGIASKGDSVFAASLDPRTIGPKAYAAATEWREHFLISLAETGSMDWRLVPKTHGLHTRQIKLRGREDGGRQTPFQDLYGIKRTEPLLREMLSREEIQAALYQYRPREYQDYVFFDTCRRLDHFFEAYLTRDPEKQEAVIAFWVRRIVELQPFLARDPSGPQIRDYIRAIPEDLLDPSTRRKWKAKRLEESVEARGRRPVTT